MSKPIRIGRYSDDYGSYSVAIEVELRHRPYGLGQRWQSVNHEAVVVPFPELSIQATVCSIRGRREVVACGQCTDELSKVTDFAPGWDAARVAELARIWDRWHLNNMRGGCAHVPEPVYETGRYGKQIDFERTPACPVSGYKYGRAWLCEELPFYVVDWAQALIDSPKAKS